MLFVVNQQSTVNWLVLVEGIGIKSEKDAYHNIMCPEKYLLK